jgi:hypothetical protein
MIVSNEDFCNWKVKGDLTLQKSNLIARAKNTIAFSDVHVKLGPTHLSSAYWLGYLRLD